MAISLEEVNISTREDFNKRFANILENCPECAQYIERKRPFSSLKHLYATVCDFVDCMAETGRIHLLKGHPDLAGKMAELGQLTAESNKEQRSVGLNTLNSEQRELLNDLNKRYKEKFGFPFIICVRENKKEAIMKGIGERLNNTVEMELFTGVEEVKKIAFYRILELIEHSDEESIL